MKRRGQYLFAFAGVNISSGFGDRIIVVVVSPLLDVANSVTKKKIAKCLLKLPKNNFTRKMKDFDTITKIA